MKSLILSLHSQKMKYTLDALLLSHFMWINIRLSDCGGSYKAGVRNFSIVSIRFNGSFNFPLVFNFVQLSRRPGTQRFIIKIVVFFEETIVDNICVTKRQRIDPIVKNVSLIVERVERHFINGYCMELVAARSDSMVSRADQTNRGEGFFESIKRQLLLC